jgi:hypothetical protein
MDELESILASDDPLTPSAGFTARVLTAVDAAATEEPPLPFPWGPFALGVLACVGVAASSAWFLSSVDAPAAFESLARVPGVGEALTAAVVSVAVAQVLRHPARADF